MDSIKLLDVCKDYHSNLMILESERERLSSTLDNLCNNLYEQLSLTTDPEAYRYRKNLYSAMYNHTEDSISLNNKRYNYLLLEYEELIKKIEPGMKFHEFEKKYFLVEEKEE